MPTTHTARTDFNGDGHADILWRNTDGTYGVWYLSADGKSIAGLEAQPDPNPIPTPLTTPPGASTYHVQTLLDTPHTEILWQDPAGWLAVSTGGTQNPMPSTWDAKAPPIQAAADFNGDGSIDVLAFSAPTADHPDGTWTSIGTQAGRKIPPNGVGPLDHAIGQDWQFQGVGDFNGDHKTDLLFRGGSAATLGTFLLEEINAPSGNTGVMHGQDMTFQAAPADWSVAKLADFNGDGYTDILWRHSDGTPGIWLMHENQVLAMVAEPNPTTFWSIVDAQDFNGDGKADILWRGQDGSLGEWFMDGTTIADLGTTLPNPGTAWTPLGI